MPLAVGAVGDEAEALSRPLRYVAFQECHSPYQVDAAWTDLYPQLDGDRRVLAGMITHTDAMLGGVLDALGAAALARDALVVVSTDNGAPGTPEGVKPSRFDPVTIERNWPFRGQKHELYEGGVRTFALLSSPRLPRRLRGAAHDGLFHVTDWLPTLLALAGGHQRLGDETAANAAARKPLDGVDQLGCVVAGGECRDEVLLNIDVMCDVLFANMTPSDYVSECPAPKAGLIHRDVAGGTGTLKLLVGCYDPLYSAGDAIVRGPRLLYNLSADPGESADLAAAMPGAVARLEQRLRAHVDVAPPFVDEAPWVYNDSAPLASPPPPPYYCEGCAAGRPRLACNDDARACAVAWEPWCDPPSGVAPDAVPPPC